MIQRKPNATDAIAALNLESHVEGGYYRRTYQTDHRDCVQTQRGPRYLRTSIYS